MNPYEAPQTIDNDEPFDWLLCGLAMATIWLSFWVYDLAEKNRRLREENEELRNTPVIIHLAP